MTTTLKFYLSITFILAITATMAQPDIKTYSLKKGQIFDVLLRNNNGKASEQAKTQFDSEVLPRAFKLGYQALPHGLYFEQVAVQGNYSPGHMVVGGWANLEARENAMQTLVKEVPDFHQIRRELWTTLFACYFEIEENMNFSIESDKVYIVTAYKYKDNKPFEKFVEVWKQKVSEAQGKVILELKDGTSPFIGHYFEPNHFTITEWPTRKNFEKFLDENLKMNHSSVKYVNQFVLRPKF